MNSKRKKISAIFFIIFGCVIILTGTFILILSIQMLLESSDKNDVIPSLIFMALVLIFTVLSGIMPLKKGINKLKNNQVNKPEKHETKNEVSSESRPSVISDIVSSAENRTLCRDKQFDKGCSSLILLLLQCIFACTAPIILSFFIYRFISKSAGYRIQAGTWQAYASLIVIVSGALIAMLALYFCGKHKALGNKFIYYIIDNDDVFYANMGSGNLSYYIKKNTPLSEKVKATPSILYIIMYALSGQNRGNALRLAKMQTYFKLNQKYCFVEKLLLSENYSDYCEKITAVKKIRFFSNGCEVFLVSLQNGAEHEIKQVIYRNTENYDLLISKLKDLSAVSRYGDELSDVQMKQVRRGIFRRTGIIMLEIVLTLILILISYIMYLSTSSDAGMIKESIFKRMKQTLAYRSEKRIYKGIIYSFFLLILPLSKMLLDIVKTSSFTCVPAEVLEYYKPKGSILKKIDMTHPYFAKVKYGNTTVDVGMNKEMWVRKDSVKPLLVLRKNIPYCLIYQEQE